MSVNSIFLPVRLFADRNHNGLQGRGRQGFLPRLQSLGKTIGFLLASQVILYCATSSAEVTDEIRDIYEGLLIGEPSHNLRTPIYADNIVTLFYEHRDFEPAWTTRAQVEKALHLLAASEEEGLTPGDYHYAELAALLEEWDGQRRKSDRTQAQFDVLMTDGLLLYARHLIEGKVDPSALEKSWNYTRQEFKPEDISKRLNEAVDDGNVTEVIEALKPRTRLYSQLKDALAFYRGLVTAGEFHVVPDDVVLRDGESHSNVLQLRKQLQLLDFLPDDVPASETFDDGLAVAVEKFQKFHAIDADGVVGAQSFVQLNTAWEQRVEQIRLNLDRVRWVWEDISDDFIVVNIAGFELYYMRNHDLVWSTEVMTGTVRTQTPMFRSQLKYMQFNPTWTVPRSIIRRSLYSKFAANPGYIAEKNYHLYDTDGVRVDPAKLDWTKYSRSNFPFRVVQQPGPSNALGRVKFIFPNQYAIYLHDTPSQQLFSRSARAFSAGCIRVQDPLEFARVLLDDNTQWNASEIQSTVDAAAIKTVQLSRPIDVLLMYWTAGPSDEGRIKLYPDVYNRDTAALKALNQAPAWRES